MARASLISLGCPRNLLDSEIIAGSLKRSGYKICGCEEPVDLYVINTCAFIKSAREESVDRILEAVRQKKEGRIKHLVICGCLPQLYGKKLAEELKEADLILGTSDFPKLPRLLKDKVIHRGRGRLNVPYNVDKSLNYLYDEHSPRLILTPRHYAYLKISEGCSNFCSYCIISKLRGHFRSRAIQSVINEVTKISEAGSLKEINIIGQDTTLFGFDRYGRIRFAELLGRLCRMKSSVEWFRILYTHPAHYTKELIEVIGGEPKICKYLDIPIQHASDKILKRMNRGITRAKIEELMGDIRDNIPGITLRTSMIVGFPGETDKDFKELLDFVRQMRFERLGAFVYSREEGTKAFRFDKQVPEKVKEERFDILMKLQQKISSSISKSFIGKTVDVLIDEKCGQHDAHHAQRTTHNEYIGRTPSDAPEIDGVVYVSGYDIKIGRFYPVKITGSMEYDLIGEKV